MDIGRIIILIVVVILCSYKYYKYRKNIYFIIGISFWLSTLYMSNHNLYQHLSSNLKELANSFSIFLVIIAYIPYLKILWKEYREK